MSRDNSLPFERGDTYFGIGAGTAIAAADAANAFASLAGKEYVVLDPDYDNHPVTLKVCQYDGSGDLTVTAVTGIKCVDFSNTNLTVFSDLAPGAAGDFSRPIDHKYSGKVIRDLDLCYVIMKGPCEVTTDATPAADEPVGADTDGELIASVAGHNHAVGFMIDAGSAHAPVTVMVGEATKTGA